MTRRQTGWVLRAGVSASTLGAGVWLWHRTALPDLGSPGWLWACPPLYLLALALLTWRLTLTLRLLGQPYAPGPLRLALVNWAGLGLQQLLFGSLSGDALRVAALSAAGDGPRDWARATAAILADRLVGVAALALLALAGLGLALPAAPAMILVTLAMTLAVAGLGILRRAARDATAAIPAQRAGRGERPAPSRPSAPVLNPIPNPVPTPVPTPIARLLQGIARLALPLDRLSRHPAGLACLALALAAHAVNVALFVVLARALGETMPLLPSLIAVPAGLFAAMLPVSLGGWGLREGAASGVWHLMGGDGALLLRVSLLYGLTQTLLGLPGLIWLWLSPGPARRTDSPARTAAPEPGP